MIQIDIPMPSCCYRCKMLTVENGEFTCCLTSIRPNDTELRFKRPVWCQLKEVDTVVQNGRNNVNMVNNGTLTIDWK